MAKKMLFGPLDRLQLVPYPESGMGWDTSKDSEVTELLSGGRHVYSAPTSYKSFSMSYKAGTEGLRPLVDIYNGVYGPGPFYLTEPNFVSGNLLPTRWASAYQLAHTANYWCKASVLFDTDALAFQNANFRNNGEFDAVGQSITVLRVPGKPLYLNGWGEVTGTASVQVYRRNSATRAWEKLTDYTFDGEMLVSGEDSVFSAVKLVLNCPDDSTLTIDHLNLTTEPSTIRLPGLGVGAVKFTNDLTGSIQSKLYDRIGLSLDLTEVE